MKLEFEATPNPGPNALFVAEIRIEKNKKVWGPAGWWGLWVTYWVLPWRERRKWLFSTGHHGEVGERCRVYQFMVCGFQWTWQTVKPMKESKYAL